MEDIRSLSDRELEYLMLRTLYRWYDASGVSCGRSIRSGIIEAIISIHPGRICSDVEGQDFRFFKKATRRIKAHKRRPLPRVLKRSHSLPRLSNRALIMLLLQWLVWYYAWDEITEEYPLTSEKRSVDTLAAFCRIRKSLSRFVPIQDAFKLLDLIEEVEDRWRRTARRDADQRFRAEQRRMRALWRRQ